MNKFIFFIGAVWVTMASANFYEVDEKNACENTISLPQGYTFIEFTKDCHYDQNLTPVYLNERYGYATAQGDIKITPRFEMAYGFDEGLALVKMNGKYGYINATGEFTIKPIYDDAWGFLDGQAKVIYRGKHGFIDKTGKFTIKPVYDGLGAWFESGLVPAKKGNKWGYIDRQGNTKIPFIYDVADGFSENMAVVGVLNKTASDHAPKFGYINAQGDMVLPISYDTASAFVDGVATVMNEGLLYHINPQGQKVTPTLGLWDLGSP